MIQAILIVGNWASGKTELIQFYEEQLSLHDIPITKDSDRLRFEEEVLQDAVRNGKYDEKQNIYIGAHSYLTKDGLPGYRHFRMRDGDLANKAHEKMIADIASSPDGILRLVEFAMGPNVDKFEGEKRTAFFQDGKYLLNLLEKYHLLDQVLVIELVAPIDIRLKRQMRRDDSTDMEAFRAFAPDGGELYPYAEKLRNHYIRFNNVFDDHDAFLEHASAILREHILPALHQEGTMHSVEGQKGKESL